MSIKIGNTTIAGIPQPTKVDLNLPLGLILPAVGLITDPHFTLLDGKTLARDGMYADFCNYAISQINAGNWFSCTDDEFTADVDSYGQCGRFVVTDDYVRIPKITRFIGATITLSEIGKTFAESLPNITGTATGHTKYPYYMVVSTTGQTSEVEIDINKVCEDLELKANKDLSNVSSNFDYVIESYGDDSGNWYKVYKSGWIEQGGIIHTSSEGLFVSNSLLKPYKDNLYTVLTQNLSAYTSASSSSHSYVMGKASVIELASISSTSFSVFFQGTTEKVRWLACGYGA